MVCYISEIFQLVAIDLLLNDGFEKLSIREVIY